MSVEAKEETLLAKREEKSTRNVILIAEGIAKVDAMMAEKERL